MLSQLFGKKKEPLLKDHKSNSDTFIDSSLPKPASLSSLSFLATNPLDEIKIAPSQDEKVVLTAEAQVKLVRINEKMNQNIKKQNLLIAELKPILELDREKLQTNIPLTEITAYFRIQLSFLLEKEDSEYCSLQCLHCKHLWLVFLFFLVPTVCTGVGWIIGKAAGDEDTGAQLGVNIGMPADLILLLFAAYHHIKRTTTQFAHYKNTLEQLYKTICEYHVTLAPAKDKSQKVLAQINPIINSNFISKKLFSSLV